MATKTLGFGDVLEEKSADSMSALESITALLSSTTEAKSDRPIVHAPLMYVRYVYA